MISQGELPRPLWRPRSSSGTKFGHKKLETLRNYGQKPGVSNLPGLGLVSECGGYQDGQMDGRTELQ